MNINNTLRYINIGLPEDILRRKLYGDFEGAIRLIDRRLERDDQPEELRNCLIAQREMMLRTPKNYPFSKSDALALIREYIPDFAEEEFNERVDAVFRLDFGRENRARNRNARLLRVIRVGDAVRFLTVRNQKRVEVLRANLLVVVVIEDFAER